jgi:hypothetical protein
MSYFLFVDESFDRKLAPYEVLAGVCIEDREIWNLIQRVWEAEERFFGTRITLGKLELKGKKLLKRKTYRLASQAGPFSFEQRRELAGQCLMDGTCPSRDQLTALAQAKIAFVGHVLELCASHRVRAFASIVDKTAERQEGNFLRKDYAYLFERFFYFLDEPERDGSGIVVFDELDKAQSRILVNQMAEYFRNTARGRMRSSRIVPEPFFVHSDLTTAIQLADLVAYIINWSVRFGTMDEPIRAELDPLADQVLELRHRTHQQINGNDHFVVWSFTQIHDLRPMEQQ